MGKIKFYVAASLDGHLSDENGSVDWLMPFQEAPYDYGYAAFMATIGFIVSGSKTYEQAKEFPGGWHFPNAHSYIFTSRELDSGGRKDITFYKGGVVELAAQLRQEERDTWLLGGAHLAGQFFNAGCVDELVLSVMPLVLGKGRPLFDGIANQVSVQLKNTVTFDNGVVQLHYQIGGKE